METEKYGFNPSPSTHEYNDERFNIWPQFERTVIECNKYQSERSEENQELLDHEVARFHDTQDIEIEKELKGWKISSNGRVIDLSASEFPDRDGVVNHLKEFIDESKGS